MSVRCIGCIHYKVVIEEVKILDKVIESTVARCICPKNKTRVTKGTKILEYGDRKRLDYHMRKKNIAPYWCPLRN